VPSTPPPSPRPAPTALLTLLAVLLTLPWLNPFALGPSPNVQPLLLSWACAALALGVVAGGRVRTDLIWRAAVWAWVAASVLSAVLGMLQFWDAASDLAPWVNQPSPGTVYANLRQRNQFATLCAMGLAALAWGLRGGIGGAGAAGFWQGLAATVVGVGLGLSGSRSGLLELLMLWALALIWRVSSPMPHGTFRVWRTLGFGALGYLLAAYTLAQWAGGGVPTVFARLWDGDDLCVSRRTLWANVWQLLMHKPWLGWGWGELGYAQFMTPTDGPRFCDILDNAHNLPLHLAVSFGLPFATAATLMTLALLWRAAPWHASEPHTRLAWAVLGLIGLHSMLEYPLWYGPFQIALVLALLRLRAPHADHAVLRSGAARTVAGLLAVALVGLCAVAAQSYGRVSSLYGVAAVRAAVFDPFAELQAHDVFLFVDEVAFSRLTTPVRSANAQEQYALAQELLHYSAEPRVIERLLESAQLLGRAEEVALYKARYAQAFPERFIEWLAMEPHVPPHAEQAASPPQASASSSGAPP